MGVYDPLVKTKKHSPPITTVIFLAVICHINGIKIGTNNKFIKEALLFKTQFRQNATQFEEIVEVSIKFNLRECQKSSKTMHKFMKHNNSDYIYIYINSSWAQGNEIFEKRKY